MLKSLHIENIAVIERADVEFSGGLSVLTGETGAGKSVMIDAINAVRWSPPALRAPRRRPGVVRTTSNARTERSSCSVACLRTEKAPPA